MTSERNSNSLPRDSFGALVGSLVDSFPLDVDGRNSISELGKMLFSEGHNHNNLATGGGLNPYKPPVSVVTVNNKNGGGGSGVGNSNSNTSQFDPSESGVNKRRGSPNHLSTGAAAFAVPSSSALQSLYNANNSLSTMTGANNSTTAAGLDGSSMPIGQNSPMNGNGHHYGQTPQGYIQSMPNGNGPVSKVMKTKGKAIPKRWTNMEDDALRSAVKNHGERNWKAIADKVEGRNHTQCLQRWTKVLAPGLVKGHWRPDEDVKLRSLVAEGRKNWGQVASHIEGRTSKQCRERWYNHLDPNIVRGEYSPKEDQIILEAQEKLGNRWSAISAMLPGRTEDAVKIRWKSLCRTKSGRNRQNLAAEKARQGGLANASNTNHSQQGQANNHTAHNRNPQNNSAMQSLQEHAQHQFLLQQQRQQHQQFLTQSSIPGAYNNGSHHNAHAQSTSSNLPQQHHYQHSRSMPTPLTQPSQVHTISRQSPASSFAMQLNQQAPPLQYQQHQQQQQQQQHQQQHMNTINSRFNPAAAFARNLTPSAHQQQPQHNAYRMHPGSTYPQQAQAQSSHSLQANVNPNSQTANSRLNVSTSQPLSMQQQQTMNSSQAQQSYYPRHTSNTSQNTSINTTADASSSSINNPTNDITGSDKNSLDLDEKTKEMSPLTTPAVLVASLKNMSPTAQSTKAISLPTAPPVAVVNASRNTTTSTNNNSISDDGLAKVKLEPNNNQFKLQPFSIQQHVNSTESTSISKAYPNASSSGLPSHPVHIATAHGSSGMPPMQHMSSRLSIDAAARVSIARRSSRPSESGRNSIEGFLNDLGDVGRISDIDLGELGNMDEVWRMSNDLNRLSL